MSQRTRDIHERKTRAGGRAEAHLEQVVRRISDPLDGTKRVLSRDRWFGPRLPRGSRKKPTLHVLNFMKDRP